MNDQLIMMIFVLMSPFCLAGSVFIMGKVVEIFLVKKGMLKAYVVSINRRLVKYFAKPSGAELKIKNKTFGFKNAIDYLVYEGSIPVTFYNEKTSEQLNMTNPQSTCPVEPDYFDNLVVRSYNLGKLSAIVNDKKMMTLIIICIIASVGACALAGINFMAIKDILPLIKEKLPLIVSSG